MQTLLHVIAHIFHCHGQTSEKTKVSWPSYDVTKLKNFILVKRIASVDVDYSSLYLD